MGNEMSDLIKIILRSSISSLSEAPTETPKETNGVNMAKHPS
jgi:hypothetical protein